MQPVRDAARKYIALGWRVVPLSKGEKFPTLDGWQTLQLQSGDVDPAFPDGSNVGIILGDGLVDADLDCPEAVALADDFLTHTDASYGRKSKPSSHRLFGYDKSKAVPSVVRFNDGTGMIAEWRAKGHQSMAPPSTHPSGEAVEWTRGEPGATTMIDYFAELRRLALCCVAVLLVRRWPAQGTRNETSLAVAGTLLQCGATVDEARDVIGAVARHVGTPQWRERAAAADATERSRAAGDPYTAGPRLAELLRGDGELAVRKIREFLGADAGQEDLLDKLNARFFVVQAGGKVVVGDERGGKLDTIWPRHEFVALQPQRVQAGKKDVPVGAWWLEQVRRRQHDKVVFAPPPADAGPRDYNVWRGFAREPRAGDWSLLRAHMKDIWCHGANEHLDYLLGWFALMAQRPGTPPEVAIVLQGGKGTGKSWPLREIGEQWLGDHFLHVSHADHLTGHFNAVLSGKVFVFADEAFWAGDKVGERQMKRLITEPTLTIERKGIDPMPERNCVHLAIAGNDKWIVPHGMRERRFFVLEVADKRQRDRRYFDALGDEFRRGGALAMLADLLPRGVTPDEVRDAPTTDAGRRQMEAGLDPVHRWWLAKLVDGRLLPSHGGWRETACSCKELFDDYIEQAQRAGEGRRGMESQVALKIREALEGLPGEQPRRARKRANGELQYYYEFPPLPECRRAWDLMTGIPRAWPDEAEGEDRDERF